GPQPLAWVRRVKVVPPSVETDAPEMLLLAGQHRESLYATTIWSGLSGLAVLYVSDWVMCTLESVCGLIKCTSAAPYARGAGSNCGERAKARQGQKNTGQDYRQAN